MSEIAKRHEARLGLGRAGASTPTEAVLDFALDHARARDAIHTVLPIELLTQQLEASAFNVMKVQSQARDRTEYLRRPDLGRLLAVESSVVLKPLSAPPANRLTVIVADGLSAQAPAAHALPVLEALRAQLEGWSLNWSLNWSLDWSLDTIVIATQARVALADPIGELRGAEATIILIGERPGLRSFDSLGAYLTYRPRRGRSDAERNCISNIRAAGLSATDAAAQLLALLGGARALGASGVALKQTTLQQTTLPGLEV